MPDARSALQLPGSSVTTGQFGAAGGTIAIQLTSVCAPAGNHDIWVRGHERHRYSNSIEKLTDILRSCEEFGVHVGPAKVGDVWIAPLWCACCLCASACPYPQLTTAQQQLACRPCQPVVTHRRPCRSWHHASFDKEPDIDMSTSAYTSYIQVKRTTSCRPRAY